METIQILLWSLGGPEIIVIAVIIILLFGGTKIPKLMKGIGEGIKEFKKGVKGDEKEEITNSKKQLE